MHDTIDSFFHTQETAEKQQFASEMQQEISAKNEALSQ